MSSPAARTGELVKKYVGILAKELGLKYMVVEVFFYLFEKKVYDKNPTHSAYDIYNSLRSQRKSFFPLFSKSEKISEKKVNESIEDLVTIGFVRKVRASHKSTKGGRPPKYLYSLKSSQDIAKEIRKSLKEKERAVLEIFSVLADEEEAAGLIVPQSS